MKRIIHLQGLWGKWLKTLAATCLLIFVSISIHPAAAYAWKPNTHVFLAEEALKDAIDDGKVSIYRTDYTTGRVLDKLGDYAVDPGLRSALSNHQRQYRAGVLGPDAYPDILTGQQVIHPNVGRPDGTDSWFKYLWGLTNSAPNNTPAIKAFVAGYLTHGAGDMYGHTFVNNFSGGEFQLGQNAVKHIVLEGYVGKRTPAIRAANNSLVTENDISIDGVSDFIYRNMIEAKPGSILDQRLLVGNTANSSVPRIYSTLRNSLQRDIQAYYDKKADFDRRYNDKVRAAKACKALDFSCSATALYAQAAAIQAEKGAYMAKNSVPVTYKEHWVRDIDRGLRAWPGVSHELAKALVFSSNGVDTDRAKAIAQKYVYDHLLSMSGAPDALGASLSFIDNVISAIFPNFIVQAIDQMKRDLLNYLLQKSFGMTVEQIQGYLKNPENYFDTVMTAEGPGQKTTLQAFNTQELKISDTGFSKPSQTFDYRQIPAAYNTVTMSKLILLSRDGMNQLLRDLGSPAVLREANAMLGFIKTLDGDNEWHRNPQKLVLAQDCNAYRQVFMRQTGERGGCAA